MPVTFVTYQACFCFCSRRSRGRLVAWLVRAPVVVSWPLAKLGSADTLEFMLATRFCARLGSLAPIVLAPMGGCAGGRLAAAVSAAGGVGLVGSGGESLEYLRSEWSAAIASPDVHRHNLGFGMNINQLEEHPPGTLEALLEELQPAHLYLSFGNIGPHAQAALDAGVHLYSNAGNTETALAHARAGATCVVMQGSDAGGHTSDAASVFSLVPQARTALDLEGYAETLLVAAGGVSDGRGVAAALALGADAAVLGTRFAAAAESEYTDAQKAALVATSCGATGTTIGTFIDAVRGIDEHSSGCPGRCIVNKTTKLEAEWRRAGGDAGARAAIRATHEAGVAASGEGLEWGATWAGASVGLVTAVKPAEEIIAEVVAEATQAIRKSAAALQA